MGSVWGSMLFAGAALGGLVAAALGREAAVLTNACTYLVSAVFIAGIRRPLRIGEASRATVLGHLGEVWRFIRDHEVVRALLVVKTGVGVANGIVGLLPAYALARFGAGDAGVGALLAARGFGALCGPFLARPLAGSDGRRLFLVCGGSILTYAVSYTFFPFTSSVVLAMVCVALAHAGGGAQWALSTYGLQVATPDEVRGRVLSLDYGVATLTIGISALAAGGAAQLFGIDAASWGLAGVGMLYGIAWLLWTRPLWSASEDPLTLRPGNSMR
jgi:predicted MFS family arabinose efflux permease